ncbi:hypothetical protein PGT21_024378 [Puccinia graminis f. sp. tritici]|uniref:Uncharacterized protein n=1 Tax=Puccinia graminis f. sp. tritici TaxID=56615 RepID=A0A5B0MXK3_PUCGR|nr:hypothetical protein PGT21_024378 [Puccinia graminis f. sp. tritici]KAA1137026.1 hypothetical protein PGTUg99_008428 [Puccinia graminis f. sp. tritici]
MVLLPKRLFFCVVLNEIVAAARLTLSSITEEAHAAQDAPIIVPSNVDLGGSSSVIAISKPTRPGAQKQLVEKDYGIIPDGLPERKAERGRMGNDRAESAKQIKSLEPKIDEKLTVIKSELEQLHYLLGTPTIDRVFRLSGLNPPINSLLPKSNPERWTPQIRKFVKQLFRLDGLNSIFKSQTKNKETSSVRSPLILDENVRGPRIPQTTRNRHLIPTPTASSAVDVVKENMKFENSHFHSPSEVLHQDQVGEVADSILNEKSEVLNSPRQNHLGSYAVNMKSSSEPLQIPHGQNLPTTNYAPLVASQEESLVLPNAQGIPLGKLPMHSGTSRILHGEVLSIIRDKIKNESITIWNSLQEKLIDISKKPRDVNKVDFQLAFLKSLFQLGDQIVRYGLLPSKFIESIEIFKPKTLLEMVKLHIDLMFLKHRPDFFVAEDSVVPEIEFLTNGLAVKHFHRSIEALPTEDQAHLVYLLLSTTLGHMAEYFPGSQLSLPFKLIIEGFRETEFLGQARNFFSGLRDAPGIEHLHTADYVLLTATIDNLVAFFRYPLTDSVNSRLEFQMVYYMLEFFDQFYEPILARIRGSWGNYHLLDKQLRYMRGCLKFFRNRDQYPSSMYENLDMSFSTMLADQLTLWINIRLGAPFNDKNLMKIREKVPKPKVKFNTWMSEVKPKPKLSFFSRLNIPTSSSF